MPTSTQDRDWTTRAASGDQDAFRSIYRAYVRPVYWVAHGILHSPADAEDVVQETFVVAWRKLPGFELLSESLLPWLVTICRYQATNRLRRMRRDRERTSGAVDESIPATVGVEDQVISDAIADLIAAEVDRLDEIDQRIFRLCAVDGYAYEAAATELGVSHAVVRNRLSRVRSRLRGAVKEARDA